MLCAQEAKAKFLLIIPASNGV